MNDPTATDRWIDTAASPPACVYDSHVAAFDVLAGSIAVLRAELRSRFSAGPALFLDAMRPDMEGDDWETEPYDLDGGAIDAILNDASGSVAALMAQVAALPTHSGSPPAVPLDRRPQRTSRLRIATYNCRDLSVAGARLYDRHVLQSNYMHALAVARALERLDADVVVLHEVEGFGVLELVRQLMSNGAEYRAYCTDRADPELGFRSAVLTRVDPVAPLGWIFDPSSESIRHFIARLHVWTDELAEDDALRRSGTPFAEPGEGGFLPLDVMGVHLPRRTFYRSHMQKASAIAAAIAERERHIAAMGHTVPLVLAGDLNSDFVDSSGSRTRATSDKRERPGGLYALHEGTGLVGCFVDVRRAQGTHTGGRRLDHILVPARLVHMARNIAQQLRTRVAQDAPAFPPTEFRSDHFPVVIDVDLVRQSVPDDEWCAISYGEILKRKNISALSTAKSVLHAGTVADRSMLQTMYPELTPTYNDGKPRGTSVRSPRSIFPSPAIRCGGFSVGDPVSTCCVQPVNQFCGSGVKSTKDTNGVLNETAADEWMDMVCAYVESETGLNGPDMSG